MASEVDPGLSECDFGTWAGLTLDEVQESDPEGLRSWFMDPEAAPHGGESLSMMVERIRMFLQRARQLDGTHAAVTHAGPIRAAIVLALEAPNESFWRIDIAPLSITELHAADYGWRIASVNRS